MSRALAESPRIVASCVLNRSWADAGWTSDPGTRALSPRPEQGGDWRRVVCEQDRAVGERLNDRADKAKPDKSAE